MWGRSSRRVGGGDGLAHARQALPRDISDAFSKHKADITAVQTQSGWVKRNSIL
jgi:hypothetical protein